MTRTADVRVETDVLVIGGGLAGCMAAIRAAETENLRVTLVDKCNTSASGCAAAGIDHLWGYIPPVHDAMGYTLDDMADDHRVGTAHGFFRRDLFDLVAGSMYERVLDLERMGIRFRYKDGVPSGGFRIVEQFHSVPTTFNFDGAPLKPTLTREARKRGVQIVNRVQMCDLLISQGQVAGAVGVHTRSGEIFAFQAKAVVLATGRSNRLSRNLCGFDFNTRMAAPLSGDGTSMAMRAGLPIVSSEFLSNILGLGPCGNYNPNYGDPRNTVQPAARIVDGRGNEVVPRTRFYDWSTLGKEKWSPEVRQRWLADRKVWRGGRASMVARTAAGEGPFYLDFGQATDDEIAYIEWSIGNEGRGTQFLRYFKGEEGADLRRNPQEYVGRWPREISGTAAKGLWVDRDLETELHNLFGAGDEVGGLPWQAGPGAITQGWHAGAQAAKRAALMTAVPAGDEEPVRERREMCREMRSRRVGFHWREVETGVQNLMDFYCGDVRSEGLLRRGLERLEDAKAAPLKAENPHELARCLDLKSIIDNAELVLRSSLERTESRPTPFGFRRADYPDQNDAEWLAFLAVRKGSDGEFRFARLPVDR